MENEKLRGKNSIILFILRIVLIILKTDVWSVQKKSHRKNGTTPFQKHINHLGFYRWL